MNHCSREKTRIGIIGVGAVGATTAYTLAISNVADEIVLIDRNELRARGEALDISHCIPFVSPFRIWAGGYEDLATADIAIITASTPMLNMRSRLDLLQKNIPIMREIAGNIRESGFQGIILNITNPVDVLSYYIYKLSGLPPERVIGTGTLLDSIRFSYLLGKNCRIDPRSVHAYILGEHGDSEVPVWSSASVGGMNLKEMCCHCTRKCSRKIYDGIFEEAKVSAYHIIRGKGTTNYAIAMSALSICRAVMNDESRVMPVSTLINGYMDIDDVYMSVPCIINRKGVSGSLYLNLDEEEKSAFIRSARLLKESAGKLDF